MKVNIGLEEKDRIAIGDALCVLLANSYLLYLKTQKFHWNVKGVNFFALHTMFEAQYQDLAAAVDEIAERIRALGFVAPGSFTEFLELATLSDETEAESGSEMVKALQEDHEGMVRLMRVMLPALSKAADEVTLGLVINRMTIHEKTAWMLRTSQ